MKQSVELTEIEALYKKCGVLSDTSVPIKNEMNAEFINNGLNADFSSIYGKGSSNNFSGSTNV